MTNKQNGKKPKKRQYFRKCGVCGRRFNQKEMIRDNCSDNGWMCFECYRDEHLDEELNEFE